MVIGIAGPMTLKLLKMNFGTQKVPDGYDFPLISFLINSLIERGIKVIAFTTSYGIESPVVFKDKNLTVCIARKGAHPGRDFFKTTREDLKELMCSYRADMIHAHWTYEFAWAAMSSGIPTLVTVHDNIFQVFKYQLERGNSIPTILYWLVRFIMNQITIRKAQYLSANSDYLYNILPEKKKKETRVIYNFFAKELCGYNNAPSKREKYVLTISNGFGKLKNIKNSLTAFSIFHKNNPDYSYYLVGCGMEENGVAHEYAKASKLTEGVKFLGGLPFQRVVELIKSATVVLHPSREESFGMSVLESMILGTPIIGGVKSGNIPYLLEHGKAGSLCDVESPESIAKAIDRLLNREDYDQLCIEAKNYAMNKYHEERIVAEYINYYKFIIEKQKSKGSLNVV